ncbi:hypothetical protein ACJX0J_033596, partial [Zea mays]
MHPQLTLLPTLHQRQTQDFYMKQASLVVWNRNLLTALMSIAGMFFFSFFVAGVFSKDTDIILVVSITIVIYGYCHRQHYQHFKDFTYYETCIVFVEVKIFLRFCANAFTSLIDNARLLQSTGAIYIHVPTLIRFGFSSFNM